MPESPVNVGVLLNSAETFVTTVVSVVVGSVTTVGDPAVPGVTDPALQLMVRISLETLIVSVGSVTAVGTLALPGVTDPSSSIPVIVAVDGVMVTPGLLTDPEGVNAPVAESLYASSPSPLTFPNSCHLLSLVLNRNSRLS